MARARPFRRLEIDAQICEKITRIMEDERYRGSFTSRVETILDLYGDGLLVDVREKPARSKSGKIATGAGAERLDKPDEQRKAS